MISYQSTYYFSRHKLKFAGCGIPNDSGLARIVNGYPTGHNEFPWMAALHLFTPSKRNKDSIGGFCGGTLVSDLYIVTAAHCIYRYGKILES